MKQMDIRVDEAMEEIDTRLNQIQQRIQSNLAARIKVQTEKSNKSKSKQ